MFNQTISFKWNKLYTLIFIPMMIVVLNKAAGQKVAISAINENRSTSESYFGNRCEVVLKLTGDEMRKYKNVKLSAITKAEDEKGYDLTPEDFPSIVDISGNPSEFIIPLKSTSRSATTIKEFSGELTLLGPTEQNGGIVKTDIAKIKGIKSLLPATSGASIVYISKELFAQLKEEDEAKRNKNIKTAAGTDKDLAEIFIQKADEFYYVTWSDEQAIFFVSGESSKILDVQLQKKDGKIFDNSGSMLSGNLIVYYFSEPVDPTSKFVIYNETDKSIKKLPFKFTNIDLP